MLCACCLGLAACGGSSSSSAASASGSAASASASAASASAASSSASAASASASAASASASAASADPAAKFVGDWKLAGMKMGGVSIVGEISSFMGYDVQAAPSVKSDGTGVFAWMGETVPFTWTATGDNTFEAALQTSSDGSGDDPISNLIKATGKTMKFQLDNGALSLAVVNSDVPGGLLFSKDGSMPGAPDYDLAKATPVKQESDLVGTWKVVGAILGNTVAYGSTEDITNTVVSGQDMTMSFEPGGKCALGGTASTYTVNSDGASIQDSGITLVLKKLGDKLIVDYGNIMGTGQNMVMVYAKA